MNYTEQTCADLKLAARFLMDDRFGLETDELVRLGIALAELAGTMGGVAV